MKILIVDDNDDLVISFSEILEAEGHHVTQANTGEQAIKKSQDVIFDVVLMDLKLPDMNGLEVYRVLKGSQHDLKLIMITGYRIEQLFSYVTAAASIHVLRKPVSMDALKHILLETQPDDIVLVDTDDKTFVPSINAFLANAGYRTFIARTFREAMDQLPTMSLDLVIFDMAQPIVYSLYAYLQLKARGYCRTALFITGITPPDGNSVDAFKSLPVTGCLFKPFDPTELLAGIDSFAAV